MRPAHTVNTLRSSDERAFAAVIPVGPKSVELWRAVELIESLLRLELGLAWCVIVDDAAEPRGLSELSVFPPTCHALTITNPRRGCGGSWRGGLSAGILTAMSWIERNTDADFVLKMDTDGLPIAPFAARVRSILARKRDAGVIGSFGVSCNPEIRQHQSLSKEPKFLTWTRLLPGATTIEDGQDVEIEGWGTFSGDQLWAFDTIRPRIDAAVSHGYASNEYCQGGAYVVSRLMVDRMAAAGYLANPGVWLNLHFGEDVTMAMHARAVGLQVSDCSGPGEPFGIQYVGLPYPPAELVSRGYSLIHSIKNDKHYTEDQIRDFFRRRTLAQR